MNKKLQAKLEKIVKNNWGGANITEQVEAIHQAFLDAGYLVPQVKEKDRHPPHKWSTGYIRNERGSRTLVSICLVQGCHKTKEESMS